MSFRLPCAIVLLALTVAGCGGVVSPSNNQIDNFTGTVSPGGAGQLHPFTASATGELTITVTSLSPSFGNYFTVAYGQMVGSSCAPIQVNQYALLNTAAAAGSIQKGSYCVQVADTGYFTTTETYNVRVSHP